MIIKASLRPLERDSVPAEDIRAAVADIGGEVARLNRLVNDVLDFARPIRFEVAEADVNRICEESAAASTAGEAGAPVRLALDPALPTAVTDAERLRSVLVNVLVNARHAVQARANGGSAPAERSAPGATPGAADAEVQLATSAAPGGRLVIAVRDCGAGIPPDQLARVFEPYFTTKRGGSGLGLAISRNIIEGLGGTISVSSRVGVGTEVRIELPRAAEIRKVENA
jgi:signal transduction histidine kinase